MVKPVESRGAPSGLEAGAPNSPTAIFWRVEGPGHLLPADLARQAGFVARNAQGAWGRLRRSLAFIVSACAMPFLQAVRPGLGTRMLHGSMRGLSRNRLDFLGDEYFARELVKRLDPVRVARLARRLAAGDPVVLVSGWLDHVVRPLARHLGVPRILCNRLEFRDGRATGRLLDPIVPSRGEARGMEAHIVPTEPLPRRGHRSIVVFEGGQHLDRLSVRESLKGRAILLIGVTGFIRNTIFFSPRATMPSAFSASGSYTNSAPFSRPIICSITPVWSTATSRSRQAEECSLPRRVVRSMDLRVSSRGCSPPTTRPNVHAVASVSWSGRVSSEVVTEK